MITKPTVIVSSLGRTGTTFFGEFFKNNLRGVKAFHEPASIHYKRKKFLKELNFNIKNFGFNNTVLKKFFGQWGILAISNDRISKKINDKTAVKKIIEQRKKFAEQWDEDLYIESSYHYYGILDLLPSAFENVKLVYIVRDPRDWVRSYINLHGWYHWSDINNLLNNRLSPKMINDKKTAKEWKNYTQFEKLCWAWNYMNSVAIKNIENLPNCKIFKYEDIFVGSSKYDNLENLVNFITDFKNIKVQLNNDFKKSLDKKIHKPKEYFFPCWQNWDTKKAAHLDMTCGPLMRKLGYGKEDGWLKKINQ